MKSAKGESIRSAYVMFAAVMAAMSAAVSAQGAPYRIGPLNAPAGGCDTGAVGQVRFRPERNRAPFHVRGEGSEVDVAAAGLVSAAWATHARRIRD